ncbi:hypothetical protein ACF0H5_015846 [Mactra antiquata]
MIFVIGQFSILPMACYPRRPVFVTVILSVLICILTFYSSRKYPTTLINLDLTNGAIYTSTTYRHSSCEQTSELTSRLRNKPNNYDQFAQNISHVKDYQRQRVANIHHVCSNTTLFNHAAEVNRRPFRYYHSTKYKFLYCKVAKVGSTFWSQAFDILHMNNYTLDKITEGRLSIHIQTMKYRSHLSYNYLTRYQTIIPARNPFSRLFSAYIDKSYLRLLKSLNKSVLIKFLPNKETEQAQNQTTCPPDVTFEDFLKYVIRTNEVGIPSELNVHWRPIYSLCLPCRMNVSVVVQQETMKQDVIYALDTLHINTKEKEKILSLLNVNRINSTIPGVVKTSYGSVNRTCFSRLDLAQRLWKAFQIQGYIRNNQSFPNDVLNVTTVEDKLFVTNVILKTIEHNPMTSDEIAAQRYQALVKAYRNITRETIRKISEMYEADFKLFGYSMEPPR